jgi:polysaccharide biosynthesis transport protein
LPQEGKTTTAIALAEAYQRRGKSVFLVDADMRSTRMVKRRSSVPQLGLSDVLREEIDIQAAMLTSGGVRMLPAGTPRGNPTRLLALPSLARVIRHLKTSHDLVIVDAPPALIGGDCEMLSRVTDATLFLAKWHDTQPEVVAEALKRLALERVAGAVLTMVDTDKLGMYSGSDALAFSSKLQRYYRHSS